MATPLRVPIRPRGRRPGYTSADAASHPPGAPTSHGARGRINVVLRQRCQNRSDPGRPPLTRRRRTDHGTPPAARGPSRLPRPRLLAVVDRAEPPGPSGPLQPEPPTGVDDHAAHRVDLQCGEVADRPSSSHRTRSAISPVGDLAQAVGVGDDQGRIVSPEETWGGLPRSLRCTPRRQTPTYPRGWPVLAGLA